MRKMILLIALISGFVLNASPENLNDNVTSVDDLNKLVLYTEVNTFCKLIAKGDIDAVKSMIAAGTDINEKSVGMTPLMYAARYNKVEIVNLLIANGAKLKVKSNKGYTALNYAEMSKAVDAVKAISKHLDKKIEKRKKV